MTSLTRSIAAAAAVATLAAAPASASAQSPKDISDATFLSKAAQANRFEIVSGQLAAQRGRANVVRKLGRQFRVHHTMALAKGSAVAKKLGIAVPEGVSAKQQAVIDQLNGLQGRRFDRAWLKAQRLAHVEAVALHLRAALKGDTDDVRTLAINALPVVSMHLGELETARR